jgi:hypothetical protein
MFACERLVDYEKFQKFNSEDDLKTVFWNNSRIGEMCCCTLGVLFHIWMLAQKS